jgi:5-hydroxyisourate hydrolase-like protein (transthyretin family)
MEKMFKLLFRAVLIPLSMALFAGCSPDDGPAVDEGDPANPTLFDYVLTVLDDESGQPRAGDAVTIKRTDKAGEVVHSSEDFTTDAEGKINMKVRSGYYIAEVAFEPGTAKDNRYGFEILYYKLGSTMRVRDMVPDTTPRNVMITVLDAKTGNPWAGKAFDLYKVSGEGVAEKVDSYTTDGTGKYNAQLMLGRYRIACAYFAGVSPMTNTVNFQVKKIPTNTADITVEPIHFADDFSWVTEAFNEGTTILKEWYSSVDPPAANSSATNELRWDLMTNADNIAFRDSRGYFLPETLAGTARFVFFRTGILKFGSTSRGGAITTPAFTACTAGATIKFSFDSNPMHVVSSGAWAVADAGNPLKIKVRVSGSGTMKNEEGISVSELTLDNPSGLNGNPAWPVDRWNSLEVVVYGAGPDTQMTIESNVLNGGAGKGCRSFIDNILVKEVY